MAQLSDVLYQAASLFSNLFDHPDWRNLVDILIVSVVIYQIFKMFAHTRANSVVKGVAIVLAFTWLTEVLNLSAINWLLQQLLSTGALLLVVLFQPELRRGLEQIGRTGRWSRLIGFGDKQRKEAEASVSEIAQAMVDLSRRRVGALIVMERLTGLSDIIESGTRLDAEISAALIENIFEPNTPLHDGAVVIKDGRIVAAACILQLSDSNTISRELGTRHRAAIGISESTDAISLIVSEETGTISAARGGKLTRYLDQKSLTALLSEMLLPPEKNSLFSSLGKGKEGGHEA